MRRNGNNHKFNVETRHCRVLLLIAVAMIALSLTSIAQNPPGLATRIKSGTSLLGTPCNSSGGNTDFYIQTSVGVFYCKAGTWQQLQNSGAAAGVSSFSGDGTLITNSGSTGAVTATLGNAAAHKFWGNNTGSPAAPGYESIGTGDLPGSGATTVNGSSCALAGSCTITAAPSGAAGGDLSGTYPNPSVSTSTTQICSDTSTKVATTAYVQSCVAAGGSSSLTLKTNGTNNGSQSTLNMANGNGVTVADNGSGTVTFSSKLYVLDSQGPTGTLTGNSADQTVYTTTIPASTLVVGSQIRVTFWADRLTGSSGSTTKLFFGSTSVLLEGGTSGSGGVVSYWTAMITVTGSTAEQMQATGNRSAVTITNSQATPAESISGSIVLKYTNNLTNTNTFKGLSWLVEVINP